MNIYIYNNSSNNILKYIKPVNVLLPPVDELVKFLDGFAQEQISNYKNRYGNI